MRGEEILNKQVDETPKNDIMFKEIFSEKEILKDFLEALLNEKIEKLDIKGDFNLRGNIHEKVGIWDIKAEINGYKIVQIEMQKENKYNMEQRTIYYGGKIISKLLRRGDNYKQMKPIILINILNYNLIELPKFRKAKPNLDNKLDQWLIFIDNKKKELLQMVTEKNKIIAKAEEKRKYLTGEAERERLQELREKAEFDEATAYAEGKERGEKRGKKIGKRETAKNLLRCNVQKEIIMKCTGLSLKELNSMVKMIKL